MDAVFINKTPHPVVLIATDGTKLTINPSGSLIRLKEETTTVGEINKVKIVKKSFYPDTVEPLPEKIQGVYYIVSATVKSALPERDDFLVPSSPVRDEEGRIVACQALGV